MFIRFETPEFFRQHGREILKQHPEWISWFEREAGKWFAPNGIYEHALKLSEFEHSPPFIRGDEEFHFRRGFYYGTCEVIQQIYILKDKGFVRPAEIGNILGRWFEVVVVPWKLRWRSDIEKGVREESPSLHHESWWDIRDRIIIRDFRACVLCGSSENLHVDHIDPVCEGGLPTDDNLQCLCKKCNYAKGSA